MIGFFRINDPFRLLAILGLMLLMSAVYLWVLEVPLLQPELTWMLLGERMADGHHMYKDIFDDTGPLSAGVYWLLALVSDRSVLVYRLVAMAVVFAQMVYLNNLFIRYKAFDENTYIPAFVIMILMHLSFDLLTLSPALMGSMFVVFALGQLFSLTVLQKEGSDSVLLVGIFGGVAACFHFPLIVFLPYMILAGIVVSGFTFSQFLLSIIGYLLPLTICAVYFFWIDALPLFIHEYILASRLVEVYAHVSLRDLLLVYALPLFFSTLGVFYGALFKPLTVNQQKQVQLMLIFVIFGLSSILLTNRRIPYQLVVLIPSMAYFISFLFISLKEGFLMQVLSVMFVVGIPLAGYGWTFKKIYRGEILQYSVTYSEKHQLAKDKHILVLGKDLGYYLQSKQVTPYLNYHHSRNILSDFDDFDDMATAYRNFVQEKPDIIVDEEGVFERLLERIPLLKESYRKSGILYFRED